MNLAEIIARGTDYAETRVADLEMDGDDLLITEACDGYFSIALNRTEIQRLIDWLSEQINSQT